MKFVDEYRDAHGVAELSGEIRALVTRPWKLMEICGGQTHNLLRYGIPELLPPEISLIHGPGCPVCVTAPELIGKAVEIARRPEVIFASFGDMLRVPGPLGSLLAAKAEGADVRIVYSPLDAVNLAHRHPRREVVFFGVGFETTAPATAMAVWQAEREGLANFSLLAAHVLVPPALEAILGSPRRAVDGILAAGHVCAVMGFGEYEGLAARHRTPIVVTGFEPIDLLEGIRLLVAQLEQGRAEVENSYSRAVHRDGNLEAQRMLHEVFTAGPREWRGIGSISDSGLHLRARYQEFDAERRFPLPAVAHAPTDLGCLAGEILQGIRKPRECPLFGQGCTPDAPIGAPMVSSEGACAAYFRYDRRSV
ncbi:MAG: hydrogenase formation protein HypD [Acidobacteria bacterium]|nr:hydrogenase formation protein HypD [Acidobacteriota bacterium]